MADDTPDAVEDTSSPDAAQVATAPADAPEAAREARFPVATSTAAVVGLCVVLLLVLGVYVAASLLSWLQGFVLNDVVQSTVRRMRSAVEAKVNRLPLSYFDRQPRGELPSRVTNDIDNVSQSLQQTLDTIRAKIAYIERSTEDLGGWLGRWERRQ